MCGVFHKGILGLARRLATYPRRVVAALEPRAPRRSLAHRVREDMAVDDDDIFVEQEQDPGPGPISSPLTNKRKIRPAVSLTACTPTCLRKRVLGVAPF